MRPKCVVSMSSAWACPVTRARRLTAAIALVLVGLGAGRGEAYSNGISGRTKKTGGAGCASCHGSTADPGTSVTLSGPTSLLPGAQGTFTLTATKLNVPSTARVGLDVAADDGTLVAVGPTYLLNGEITHSTPITNSNGTGSYDFLWTMPSSAVAGSTHTLYAAGAVGRFGSSVPSWNHASNFIVTTAAPPPPPGPSSCSVTGTSSSSITLSWTGSTPEFRVVYQSGNSAPVFPTDGTLLYEGAATTATASGLAASLTYSFSCWGKLSGQAVYSAASLTVSATTASAPTKNWYVDAAAGSDTGNDGLSLLTPFKTITKAMNSASSNDTINVGAGTYNVALGESFPITVKSGVALKGGGAAKTVIDLTGANTRAFECSGNNALTLIEGFLIKGGFVHPAPNQTAEGGAIFTTNNDQTKISRNVFVGNEARGYDGTSVYNAGGPAVGGALFLLGSNTVTNNVFLGNVARGGSGVTRSCTENTLFGGTGQFADGGAIYATGNTHVIVNNTFFNNRAYGGDGGSAPCTSGGGGGAGNADSGALFVGDAILRNNLFSRNSATGGTGGVGSDSTGGDGLGQNGALYAGGTSTVTNNLFFDNTSMPGGAGASPTPDDGTVGTAAITGTDPLLHSPGNMHLRHASPARAAGTATDAPTVDLEDTTRPDPPTIGAFEVANLTAAQTASLTDPATGSEQTLGTTGVKFTCTSFSGGYIAADRFDSGRAGTVPTSNASSYFWAVATSADTLACTVKFDWSVIGGNGVGNPSTVKLLRRDGGAAEWSEVSAVTRSGSTISATVSGFSDFALGGLLSATTTTVTAAPSPADTGHPISFTATVTGTTAPSGSVSFSDGTNSLGAATLVAVNGTSSTATLSIASCSTTTTCLHPGSYTIAASYAGDASNAPSSGSVALTVNQSTTTTTLETSASTITFGQAVTFTALVVCHSGSPGGTVTFKDGSSVLGTATIASNLAALTVSNLAVGVHSITAAYGGSSDFLASTSSALTQTVSKASTTTSLSSSPNPSTFGQSVTFTATVISSAGTPTGTVTFKEGATTLGNGTLSAGSASLPTSALGAGTHTVTAEYGGDADFLASTSSTLTQTVNAAVTPAIAINDVSVAEGDVGTTVATLTVSLSAAGTQTVTVAYATADGTATAGSDYTATSGTVTFIAGETIKVVQVPVLGDTSVEPDETFTVDLSGASGATISDSQGVVTIKDDDLAVTSFTVSPTVTDRAGSATLAWQTEGATSVDIAGVASGLPASGTTTAGFTQTTTYTLTATEPGGKTATATATVTVLPQPGVSLALPTITAPSSGATIGVSGVTFAWDAVTGAAGYDLRIFDGGDGGTVFTGSLLGGSSASTLISLPNGNYLFAVRACTSSGFSDATCGSFATRSFTISLIAPTEAPTITAPLDGANLTTSTQALTWTSVTPDPALPTMTYEVVLEDLARNTTALQINVPHPSTSTIFSLRSSPLYRMRVRACQAACGPFSSAVGFSVTLGAVPSSAPSVNAPAVTGGNQLDLSWSAVSGADLYQIQVVQPPPAGPGGGALTVAAQQISATSVSLSVPAGQASILVAACNGDGCGPFSSAVSINPSGPNPSTPNPGTPMAGTAVSGPTVLFTWNRIDGDDGTNTTYRVYVQDLSRQAAALDVRTTDNFYAAYFKAEGARYDVLVIANPGCTGSGSGCSGAETAGPSVGFNVAGTSSEAPTMVSPAHNSTLAQGNIQLGWSPVSGATLYEYFVAVQGQSSATVRGVTPGLFVQVPLTTGTGDTVYSGIVRACPAGAACASGSDAGWGPWSNQAGPGVTNFTVTP